MRRKLGFVCAGLLAIVAAAASVLAATAPVAADSSAPAVAAWWNLQNQGIAAPPAPQGVNPGDLFVEGVGGDRQLPAAPPAPFPNGVGDRGATDAISGLIFSIPTGARVDKLTLYFDGAAPANASVLACVATAPFGAQENGPWADVPPYDCSKTALGTVAPDGKSIAFADIGALVNGATLAVVLVPQYADREIWKKPGPDALAFTAPPPTFDTSTAPQPFFATSTSTGPGSSAGQFPAGTTAVPAAPAFSASAPTATTPAQAPATTANGVPRVSVAAPAVVAVDPNVARIVAGVTLAAALGLFALLMSANSSVWRRLFGARAAAAIAGRGGARGVGRFASVREGRPDSV